MIMFKLPCIFCDGEYIQNQYKKGEVYCSKCGHRQRSFTEEESKAYEELLNKLSKPTSRKFFNI